MAATGFEGFEKRLELHFSGDEPMGLRQMDFTDLKQVLDAVQCSVVSAMGNMHLDAYVLSESSLFVYPHKMIIKTCGTTHLLKSIPALLAHAFHLGLTLTRCRYTRGSFIFPDAQPFPHTSFTDEVMYLDTTLPPHLAYRKASILPFNLNSSSHSWHVYTAATSANHDHAVRIDMGMGMDETTAEKQLLTIEVCMTQLDRCRAGGFYRAEGDQSEGDMAGRAMTVSTGIGDISPEAIVCDYAFDPCGYSMNGIVGDRYSTIHVTPEEGFSYASFECVVPAEGDRRELERALKKVARVFGPGVMSVAVTSGVGTDAAGVCKGMATVLETLGMECRGGCRAEDFPAIGNVAFQTLTCRRR